MIELVDERTFLETLNSRVSKTYRLDDDELNDVLKYGELYQVAELYRAVLRKIERTSRLYRTSPPTTRSIRRLLNVSKDRARYYLSTCGAWGYERVEPYTEEERQFAREMCRPEKYRDAINDAIQRGFDPPTLPPDMYDRYMKCRRLHEAGYVWMDDGRFHKDRNSGGERKRFGATIERQWSVQ